MDNPFTSIENEAFGHLTNTDLDVVIAYTRPNWLESGICRGKRMFRALSDHPCLRNLKNQT